MTKALLALLIPATLPFTIAGCADRNRVADENPASEPVTPNDPVPGVDGTEPDMAPGTGTSPAPPGTVPTTPDVPPPAPPVPGGPGAGASLPNDIRPSPLGVPPAPPPLFEPERRGLGEGEGEQPSDEEERIDTSEPGRGEGEPESDGAIGDDEAEERLAPRDGAWPAGDAPADEPGAGLDP